MEQTIKITLPDDPVAPAQVVFDGPLGDVALRLSEEPGSGWTFVGPHYLVDRKLVVPKPRRKGRPDASERMRAYNEAKKAPAEPDPDPEPQPTPSPKPAGLLSSDDVEVKTAPRTKEDGTIWSELEPKDQTPVDPNDPWGGFQF